MEDEQLDRLRAAGAKCTQTLAGRIPGKPADSFRALADACDELGIDEWDRYGDGGPVTRLETQVTELLGTESAAFFPSGTMAQQIALRVWSDRAGTRRIAMPDLSHLLRHEMDGARFLHRFDVEHLTTGPVVATADDLTAIPGRLAAVLIELPLRDAGCLVPTWTELTELSEDCRDRGVPLHFDGARIWEVAASLDHPFHEIASLADSVYVSFYKGLGGLAGCCLAGPADFVDEARRWRTRHGGTIYRSTPEAVAALAGLRDELPVMRECLDWGRALAAALPAEFRVHPEPPHTNTFLLFAAGDAASMNETLIDFAEQHGILMTGPWFKTDEPGRARTELAIGSDALDLDPAEMAASIGELLT